MEVCIVYVGMCSIVCISCVYVSVGVCAYMSGCMYVYGCVFVVCVHVVCV